MSRSCLSELQILVEAIRVAKDIIVETRLTTMGYKPSNWSEIARDVKQRVRRALDTFNNSDCECHHMPSQLFRCQAAKLSAQWISDSTDDELWETSGMAIQIERAPGDFANAASDVVNSIGQFIIGAAEMTARVLAILIMIVIGLLSFGNLQPQW